MSQSKNETGAVVHRSSDRLSDLLACSGQIGFEWSLTTDQIVWTEDVDAFLKLDDADGLVTGRKLAARLNPTARTNRNETIRNSIHRDSGDGVRYTIEYELWPGDPAVRPSERDRDGYIWVEENGRWFADADGRPARAVGTIRIVTERKQRELRLEYLSARDELTGQMNRMSLRASLMKTMTDSARYTRSSAFALAAIDNLAMINEAYGYDVADQVIIEVARRLEAQLRSGDVVGRVAGNKFGVVLANCTEENIVPTVERLLGAVRNSVIETDAGPVSVTISIGAVPVPNGARTAQEALSRAEEVLSEVKITRRDNFGIFQPSVQRDTARKHNLAVADEIVSALNDRRFCLAYQPIRSADTREVALHECLLRMVRPDGEIVSAGKFIPVAEKLGLVRLLDNRALELTIATLHDFPEARLAFNVSGMTATDQTWLRELVAYIGANRSVADRLIVEITETVAIHDLEESAQFVSTIRSLGCQVAIDDFGAGYTSFRNLKTLDVNMVKIDGSFVRDLVANPENQIFVRTLADLARNFNLATVAEWVNTEEEIELLKSFGVDLLQGYYLGEPETVPPWRSAEAPRSLKPAFSSLSTSD